MESEWLPHLLTAKHKDEVFFELYRDFWETNKVLSVNCFQYTLGGIYADLGRMILLSNKVDLAMYKDLTLAPLIRYLCQIEPPIQPGDQRLEPEPTVMKLYNPSTERHRNDLLDRLKNCWNWELQQPTNMRNILETLLEVTPGTTAVVKPTIRDVLDVQQRRILLYFCPHTNAYQVVTEKAQFPATLHNAAAPIRKSMDSQHTSVNDHGIVLLKVDL